MRDSSCGPRLQAHHRPAPRTRAARGCPTFAPANTVGGGTGSGGFVHGSIEAERRTVGARDCSSLLGTRRQTGAEPSWPLPPRHIAGAARRSVGKPDLADYCSSVNCGSFFWL